VNKLLKIYTKIEKIDRDNCSSVHTIRIFI